MLQIQGETSTVNASRRVGVGRGEGGLQLVSLTAGLATQSCVNYRMAAVPRLSQVQAHYCHRRRPPRYSAAHNFRGAQHLVGQWVIGGQSGAIRESHSFPGAASTLKLLCGC